MNYERTKVGKLVLEYFKQIGHENPKLSTQCWFVTYNPILGMRPTALMKSRAGRDLLVGTVSDILNHPINIPPTGEATVPAIIRVVTVGIVRLP